MAISFAPADAGQLAGIEKRHHHHWWLGGLILLGFLGFFTILGAASQPATTQCRLKCASPPPPSQSLGPPATYRSSAYGYSVSYDPSLLAPDLTTASSVGWIGTLHSGGRLEIKFTGQGATNQSPDQLVSSMASNLFPQFSYVYSLPGAEVGYLPGYGAVYDGTITPPGAMSEHRRVVILAAIKGGVAITVIFTTPFHGDDGNGFPDPAQLSPAFSQFTDDLVNSVTWR